ncbi:helix-turn-helix transcriptional regulator [bacterium]|nr:helix-turn-helix transcriptional regulator [bacterium]
MNIKKLLGKRLQEIRKKRNITQEHLAEMVELDTSSISHIENGKYYPNAENLDKILNVLNIKPSEIFTFENFLPKDELIEEMLNSMKNDDKLTRLMYKFYQSVKYQ